MSWQKIVIIILVLGVGLSTYSFITKNQSSPIEDPINKPAQLKDVKLYYYNPQLDRDTNGNILCSSKGLVAVERQIPTSLTPIQDTIKLLISGNLTEIEKAQGLTTEFPLPGFKLTGANLVDKLLTLEFTDPENKTVGGSCRVSILWSQIETTAKQFSEVSEVRFIPEELFQP